MSQLSPDMIYLNHGRSEVFEVESRVSQEKCRVTIQVSQNSRQIQSQVLISKVGAIC